MKYTVVWVQAAEDRLAELYTQAPDKAALSAASNAIDRLLAHDSERKGRPLNGSRFLTVPPLPVVFMVYPDDRLVVVREVHRCA
jgi:hypothetical protein